MDSLFIFNPDFAGNHCHSPGLEKVGDRIFLTWYAYPEKEHEGAKICYSSCDINNFKEWSKPKICFPQPGRLSQGNPTLFYDSKNDQLNLFFVVLKWTYWDSARVMHSKYDSSNDSWTEPQFIDTPEAIMTRHRPLVSQNKILIPAYDEKNLKTVIYESTHPYSNWREIYRFDDKAIQADLMRTGKDEILAFFRSSNDKKIVYRALSAEEGSNWTGLMGTTLLCPWSGIAAIKLNSQTIIVAHNDTEAHSRGLLSLSITHDKGLNFKPPIHLEGKDIEVSYPSLLALDEENFLLAYTFGRKMIKVQKINFKELFDL